MSLVPRERKRSAPQTVQPDERDEVADRGSPEGVAWPASEARVVGRERKPRRRHGHGEVDALPEREAARCVGAPEIAGARTVQRPPREVADGRGHRPDREPPDVLADEGDRAGEGERKRDRPEDEDPDPALAEAEDAVSEGVRRCRDDDQLEGRPAQVLHDVEHRRRVRAALPERLPHEHHPREAALGADVAREAKEGAAEDGADDDREQSPLEAQAGEVRAGDQDEQADAEVPPEQGEVAE